MLYKLCIFQIAIYLFLSPFIRSGLGTEATAYSFDIAVLFTLLFIAGGMASSAKKRSTETDGYRLSISLVGKIILSMWSSLYAALSLRHGLINRRMGTDVAAVVFSKIPPIELIVLRAFEILLPFIVAYVVIRIARFRLSISDQFLAFSLAFALIFSGIVFSRSQVFLLFISSAIILQNSLSRWQLRKLVISVSLVGVLVFSLVSVSRGAFDRGDGFGAYFADQIAKRVDGLELISLLTESYGYQATGINPIAVVAPVVAANPFMPGAVELKENALTTVKGVILALEYDSLQGDTNSFVLVDVYYWGGIIGLMISAVFLGFVAKKS